MLLEIAIGDAYGAGFEFCAMEKIRRHNNLSRYVPHELGIHAGHYTDDTQMSIAVAEVLLALPPYTSAVFAESFVACYRRDPRQGYATRFQALLGECADGAALMARIYPQSRRNGAAMRSVPLGLIADKATLLKTARQQAAITHDTPEGILSSQIVALMAHALLYEGASLAALPGVIQRETSFVLDLDWHAEVACDALQTLHAVATALHRNRRMSALLLDCINFGGDVDSVAAIAFGLASLSPEYSNDIPAVLVSSLEGGAYGGEFLAGLDRQLAENFPVLARPPRSPAHLFNFRNIHMPPSTHVPMQAAFITAHGGNEAVSIGPRPKPVRQPGHVLVRLQAATLNRVDLYMRDSGAGITHQLPQIMGLDGAGIVEEADADERLLKPGQSVVLHPGIGCGRCEFCQRGEVVLCVGVQYLGEHRDGTLAQWVSLPAQNVFAMPAHLNFTEAAALGVNHLTAWRMLFTKGQLKPWETVLIFGIGGGVSLAALQLAKLSGAQVLVTSRDAGKLERARALGADHLINSSTQDVVKEVMARTGGRGVDVVIENIGAAVWSSAMKSLVRGGRLVTCGATTGDQPPADLRRIFIRQLQILGSTLGNFDEFRDLLRLVERTGLRPVIDSEYPLEQVHAALDRLESGAQFGKIAIRLA